MERPKVRFSQTVDKIKKCDNITKQKEDEGINSNSKEKVKVKSIIPVNFPMKILKNGKRVLLKDQSPGIKKDIHPLSSVPEINISYVCDRVKELSINTSDSEILTDEDCLERQYYQEIIVMKEDKKTTDKLKTQKKNNEFQQKSEINNATCNTRKTVNEDRYNKTCEDLKITNDDHVETSIPCITCNDSSDENSDVEIIDVIKPSTKSKSDNKNIKFSSANKTTSFNKLNKDQPIQIGNKENRSRNCEFSKEQKKLTINNKTKILKDTTNSSSKVPQSTPVKKIIRVKKKVDVMPCAKFRVAAKSKCTEKPKTQVQKTQVKKSTVRHITGNHCQVSVERETLNKHCDNEVENYLTKETERKNIDSKDLLSRPEYNSTICVIKKLKDIEKEKVIPDFDKLPPDYKHIIYGKVSTALDFAPYESVYKDLVDLNIEDDKWPPRLMRSKDPEPRNKDIVPKLSDFYTPKHTEQYFVITNPAPPNPINVNTLNAFTISNKIHRWKLSRNHF